MQLYRKAGTIPMYPNNIENGTRWPKRAALDGNELVVYLFLKIIFFEFLPSWHCLSDNERSRPVGEPLEYLRNNGGYTEYHGQPGGKVGHVIEHDMDEHNRKGLDAGKG